MADRQGKHTVVPRAPPPLQDPSADAVAEQAGFREGSLEEMGRKHERRWTVVLHWAGIGVAGVTTVGAV